MTHETLTPSQRVSWLRLIRTANIGPVTFRSLLNRFGSADAALDALPSLPAKAGAHYTIITHSQAEDEIAEIDRMGARLVALPDHDYPPHLRHAPNPPPLLTVQGDSKTLANAQTVAIVGARNASAAGKKMTQLLAHDLGIAGFVVISGLARGIDAMAHQTALQTGTIAVLAGGLNKLYPTEHEPLARAILENNGALITEMPMNWEPRSVDFPRRNRLVAGLSLGTVVVEAAKRSGSLITARLALEANREVFAIPGSPLDPRAEGGNALIQQGATLITSAQDIITALGSRSSAPLLMFEDPVETWFSTEGYETPSLSDRDMLLNALSVTPIAIDLLVELTDLPVSSVQILLIELELEGKIIRSDTQGVAISV